MMEQFQIEAFPLGQIVITANAQSKLTPEDQQTGLNKHARRNWGDVCREDWDENDLSLEKGYRILSSYKSKAGEKFWIITEADRSATTILLPEDY